MIRLLRRYVVEVTVLVVGLGLRFLLFPPAYVPLQEDELGYAADGLLLLEGVALGFKFAPGAFTTWLGFAYGAASWAINTLNSLESSMAFPLLVKPFLALDQTLFDIYADMSGVHTVIVVVVLVTSLLGVYGATRIGRHFAGWPGALLVGGLAAVAPLQCWFAVQSRPYSPAWSLTILSLSVMITSQRSTRWTWAGIIYGLAVASRIEMLLVVPLFVWLVWAVSEDRTRVRCGVRMTGAAVLAFLISAPWFIGHLVGNVRKMMTVVVLEGRASETLSMVDFMMNEGLAAVVIVTVIGVLLRCRSDGWKAWVAVVYLLVLGVALVAVKTSGGLRHAGHSFVIVMVLSGFALGGIQRASGKRWGMPVAGVVAVLALSLPFARSMSMAREVRSGWVKHDAVGWIESHVPAGSRVFLTRPHTKIPLPTQVSADRIWAQAAHQTAWSEKLEGRLAEIGVELDYVPRGLSMEHMYQELSGLRRYFILGGVHTRSRPRYDLKLLSRGEGSDEFWTALDEFQRDGGVFWHWGQSLDGELGPPSQAWLAPNGNGMFLYTRLPTDAGSLMD